jgi:excisionase family DNA binding protein
MWMSMWTFVWTSSAHPAAMTTTTSHDSRQSEPPTVTATSAAIGASPDESRSGANRSESRPANLLEPPSLGSDRLVFSVAEAGELLGLSRAFAYELVARGELPIIRFGRRIVVPKAALLELLNSASSEN